LSGLGDTSRNTGDEHVYHDREESGEDSGKRVLSTTVLGYLDDLADDPADDIHPGHGSGERETRDDRVKRLSLELLGDKIDGLESGLHCEFYTIV